MAQSQPCSSEERAHEKVAVTKSSRSNVSALSEASSSTALHDIPFSKIKDIIQTSTEELKPNDEGLFAMTKAAEEFIKLLARGAYDETGGLDGSTLEYTHLAEFVAGNDQLRHIHEVVPRKVKFSTIEHLLQSNK